MTKEEAIKQFETLLFHVDTDCVMGMETTEAINMAIKALKQLEPCEDDPRADVYYLAEKMGIHQLYALVVQLRGEPEPCEDAVSRQAAIRACGGYMVPVGIIKALPPVTPKQRTGKWIKITNTLYKCNRCGAVQLKGNYCKDCGAKMEGVNNDT